MFSNNSSYHLFNSTTAISELFSNNNLSFDHNFLIDNKNSNFIQPEQLKNLDPKISIILNSLNYLVQNNNKRAIYNQTIADAYIQSNLLKEEQLEQMEVDSLDFIVKINQNVPLDIAIFMFGYIMPLLLIITILFNSMIVIVLSQKHLRTPTNMVLLSMAIFDMLTLITPAPWYFYAYFLGRYHYLPNPRIFCYLFHWMNEVLPAFFHTASIWLTLLLAGQSYMPMNIFPFPVQYKTEDGRLVKACQFSTAAWVNDFLGENLYFGSYYCFRILFVHVIPCSALVILNLLLFRTLKLARQNRKKLFSRCSGPLTNTTLTPNKTTTITKLNNSNEENLIFQTNQQSNEFIDTDDNNLNKQNLRSKLSNAFTTIILSNNSLSNKPNNENKNNSKGLDEVSSSNPLTEDTLPSQTFSNNNSNYNLNNSSINNQTTTNTENQLMMAHQITKSSINKTSSSSSNSIHSYTISNQISSPTNIYHNQIQTSSSLNGQNNVNTAIIKKENVAYTNSNCKTSAATTNSTLINNLPLNNKTNNNNSYITNNTENLINSNKLTNNNDLNKFNCLNENINLNEQNNLIDNLVNNQEKLTSQQDNLQCNNQNNKLKNNNNNNINYRSNSTANQLNLPSNQLKNLASNDKPLSDNLSSTSYSSPSTVQKQASCKKMNTLECRRQRDNQCTTLMLVVVVSVFLATEIPLAITTLLHVTQNILDIYIANYKTLNSTILFTNFFIMLSYPVNFAIYCGMSRQFRDTFKSLILNRFLCKGKIGKANTRFTTTTNATYSNYECSQFRRNSVTNQLITLPSTVINLKNKLTNQKNNLLNRQQTTDYSNVSNHNQGEEDERSTNSSKQSKNSIEDNDVINNKKDNNKINDDRRIRFKTNSFELENCDLNNNDANKEKDIYSNTAVVNFNIVEQQQLNFQNRPPYIETNL